MSTNAFMNGIGHLPYASNENHRLLTKDAWFNEGPNIGENGCNLTITFLSLNRTSLSKRLLDSIDKHLPEFAGEVLIIDNGSSKEELDRLYKICEAYSFKWRLIELGRNHGVAGGRNRTIPHVHTDWLISLDNDIYFISNPLKQIQSDLARLGCHFMDLPLLDSDEKTIFARGGHLYVLFESGELHIGAGSVCKQAVAESLSGDAFLCTFLFGGACIFNVRTFQAVGGFDDAMFVGFEDIDFSIRLFQQGYKVGSTAELALVHDHPKPQSNVDRDYEKERFSREILYRSAQHMEAKHGFKVWNEAVDEWLKQRQEALSLEKDGKWPHDTASTAPVIRKPKIGLIIDTEGWAFSNIARQLQHHLADRYDFIVIPMDVIADINQVLMLTEDCDLVHFFWREHLRLIGTPYYRSRVESLGIDYVSFEERFVKTKKFTTSVYDHLLLESKELEERAEIYKNLLSGYSVGSNKLFEIYSNTRGYAPPTAVLEDGVDLSLFKPMRLERFGELPGRELVVGWVGNSKWASEIEDFKGLHTILKPAIELLRAEGLSIKSHFADRQERFIPHSEMPQYYAEIDVYVCTSKIEGTPNPVLESMACGVPVISTDVGIVPQAFGPWQRQFILTERSVKSVADSLRSVILGPEILKQLSQENLEMVQSWDWKVKADQFHSFFQMVLRS